VDEHVFGDGQGANQAQLLVDDPDPRVIGIDGGGKIYGLSVQENRAAVRRVDAGDDLHQGAFPGPVLSHDPVDLSIFEGDGYPFEGPNPAEMLGDIFYFQHMPDLN